MAKKKAAKKKKATTNKKATATKKGKANTKKAAKKKATKTPAKKVTAKPKRKAPQAKQPAKTKKPPYKRLTCNWTISNLVVRYDFGANQTRFSYTRTNPNNAQVRAYYSGSPGTPPVNEVTNVRDRGRADCSGNPQPSWSTDTVIAPGNTVVLQLWESGARQVEATTIVV